MERTAQDPHADGCAIQDWSAYAPTDDGTWVRHFDGSAHGHKLPDLRHKVCVCGVPLDYPTALLAEVSSDAMHASAVAASPSRIANAACSCVRNACSRGLCGISPW
jgi:hypothetical protein